MTVKRRKAQLKNKVCPICNKKFKAHRSDAIFCSPACRQKRNRDLNRLPNVNRKEVAAGLGRNVYFTIYNEQYYTFRSPEGTDILQVIGKVKGTKDILRNVKRLGLSVTAKPMLP